VSSELRTAGRLIAGNWLLSKSILIGFLTMAFDFVFHQSFTNPMEIPVYFAMKFFSALVIAYFLIPRWGIVKSALVFTVWVDVYYGLFVVALGIPGLSSSPSQIIAIGGIGGAVNQIPLLGLWTVFHGVFFWLAAWITGSINPRQISKTVWDW
jgi:hypothetical protein